MTTQISTLLRPARAAEILDTSVGVLAVWRSTKRYPLRYCKIGSKIFYRAEDLQDFIERRTHSGVSEESARQKRAR